VSVGRARRRPKEERKEADEANQQGEVEVEETLKALRRYVSLRRPTCCGIT
jgi:hypothetical protein